jgi:hypothetical protein
MEIPTRTLSAVSTPPIIWRLHWSTDVTRRLLSLVVLTLGACFPRPLDLRVSDANTGQPVEGVAMHKHAISLLSLLPSRQEPVRTAADGSARVWVPPLNTNVTLLRPGYEPASLAVYRKSPPESMRSDDERIRLTFDELDDGRVVPMPMKPVKRTPFMVRVVDQRSGDAVPEAEVLAGTFLFLPAPGLEEGWGFPDLQQARPGEDGSATLDLISGFRNRITARAAGWSEAQTDLREAPGSEVALRMRPLRWKPVQFEVLEEKRGTPVTGAWVTLEEPRRGLPPDPNAFAGVTDETGLTPMLSLPDRVPLVVHISAPGHRDRREALDWSALGEGDIRTVWIRKKGWFE